MKKILKFWPLLIFGVILCFTAYVYSSGESVPKNQNPFMDEQEKKEEWDRKFKEMIEQGEPDDIEPMEGEDIG